LVFIESGSAALLFLNTRSRLLICKFSSQCKYSQFWAVLEDEGT
jgi:hypothetical protein